MKNDDKKPQETTKKPFRLRTYLGVGPRTPTNSKAFHRAAQIFDGLILISCIWIGLHWYLQQTHIIGRELVKISDWVIWLIFIAETTILTSLAYNKVYFLKHNWLNIFIIITAFPFLWHQGDSSYLAIVRFFRLLVVSRLFITHMAVSYKFLKQNNLGQTFLVVLSVTIFSGIIFCNIESSVKSPWEGIWWAWETVSTVGYGDIYPKTVLGKIFASFVMCGGVALFSLVAANLAAFLVRRGQSDKTDKKARKMLHELRELTSIVQTMREDQAALSKKITQFIEQDKNRLNSENLSKKSGPTDD